MMAVGRFRKPHLGGAVYILPNLLTTGNLFYGFFSIVKCLQGDYKWAASAIILAAIFDILDGRVARLTGGTSEFGVQYDSLCDLVSFGLAPAFLVYKYGLQEFGRGGWILCFVFLACGALRLARFNVQSSIGKSSGDFTGLPIPMAAITVACFIATCEDFSSANVDDWFGSYISFMFKDHYINKYVLLIACPLLSVAMVSNIIYRSHKRIKIGAIKPFRLLVLFVLLTGLIASQPELFGLLFTTVYALSGPFEWLLGWKKPTDEYDIFAPVNDDDSVMEPANLAEVGTWQENAKGDGK